MTVHTVLRSDDPPDVRAARIMEHAGIDAGDPAFLARHRVRIAEIVEQYRQIDAEARR